MAKFNLPNGSIVELATAMATSIPFTAITNAAPAVVTAPGNSLDDGDIILVNSGWDSLDGRVARVADATADGFALDGIRTVNTRRFPTGSGAGSVVPVATWIEIDKILTGPTTSGGDQQFWTGAFLADDDESQIPTTRSPMSMAFGLGDDPGSARDEALEIADESREPHILRIRLSSGAAIYYSGYISYNQTPVMERNNPMYNNLTFSLTSRPVRYAPAA